MKYKPKIKYKLMAAFMAAISLFCLSYSASAAWTGLAGGATGDGGFRLTSMPYGYLSSADVFAWRADLYVSANADGKINKDRDTVGSTYLPLVGSVLCVSPTYANGEWWKTYLQTNYTNEMGTRDSFDPKGSSTGYDSEGNVLPTSYTLPTLKEFEPSFPSYEDASGHTVAIAVAEPGKGDPFEGQYGLSTNFSVVQGRLTGDDADTYTARLIEQIGSKYGEQAFFTTVFDKVNSSLQNKIVETANANKISFGDAIKRYILPNGESPMVEWALVITPTYRFVCNAPFYYSASSAGITATNFGLPYVGGGNCVALDAYWFAQYERTSMALGKDGKYAGLSYTGSGGVVKNVWQNQTIGLLSFYLENNAGSPAAAAYCTEESVNNCYLGVYTHKQNFNQFQWYSLLRVQPSEYAKRGGIAVFTTKITTPEAPVYYHTYTYEIDENNPPDGYTVGTAYSQSDLLKFIDRLPSPTISVTQGSAPTGEYYYPTKDTEAASRGVPVAAMTPSPTIKQPGATKNDYPTYNDVSHYLQKFPGTIPEPSIIMTPLADSAALKTPEATPDNTADDPKEFHVKIVHIEVIPEVPAVTTPSLRDRIKSYDVTQLIEDTWTTIEAANKVLYRHIVTNKKVVQNYCYCNNY